LLSILCVFALADIRFAVAESMDESGKNIAKKASLVIAEELKQDVYQNFDSKVYVEDAALVAVKNGYIDFCLVGIEIFRRMGLDPKNTEKYGLTTVYSGNGYMVVSKTTFLDSFGSGKKDRLIRRLSMMESKTNI
jgi:hypothetical protein